jgi:Bifunctional DNA primase/polymerase, N-terminal
MKHMVYDYLELGFRLVPCVGGTKRPIIPNWTTHASNDRDRIKLWLRQHKNASWAVLTGRASDIIVIDAESDRSLDWIEDEFGKLLAPKVRTGFGWHVYVRYPVMARLRSRVVLQRPSGEMVELRGNNHLALLPPSRHPEVDAYYEWLRGYEPWPSPNNSMKPLPIPRAPQWVIDAMAEPERKPYQPPAEPLSDRYVQVALTEELVELGGAPKGTRNDSLNLAAFRLFRFGQEHAERIAQELGQVAVAIGLNEHKSRLTIRSAARARGVNL